VSELAARPYEPGDADAWEALVASASTGTLFHARRFLAYHRGDRFTEHSYVLTRGDRLVGVLPAHVLDDLLVSPFGASVGGLVLADDLGLERSLEGVALLCARCRSDGLRGLEMRLGPTHHHRVPTDTLPFALARSGFAPTRQWLSPVVALADRSPDEVLERLSKGKRRDVRRAGREGVVAAVVGGEGLAEFQPLLDATYARHGSPPTHSAEDLARLLELLPGEVRLVLARRDSEALAGILVFVLNEAAAYTMYICETEAGREVHAAAAALTHAVEVLGRDGLRSLDLGPSASDEHVNSGVLFFKQGFTHATGRRTTWRWTDE
jgi:hypothetical protein